MMDDELPFDDRLDDIYPGVVVDIDDPLMIGRVRAKVSVIGDDFPTEWLTPSGMTGAGPSSGLFWPPPLGGIVWVTFTEGDPDHGSFQSGSWAAPGGAAETPEAFQRVSPTNRGLRTPGGHLLEFDDDEATQGVRLTSTAGWQLAIDDVAASASLLSPGGFALVLDEAGGTATLETASGLRLKLDEATLLALLETPGGFHLSIDEAGHLIELTDGGTVFTFDPSGVLLASAGKVSLADSANAKVNLSGGRAAIGNDAGELFEEVSQLCAKAADMALEAATFASNVASITVGTAVGASTVPVNAADFLDSAVNFVNLNTAIQAIQTVIDLMKGSL